MVTEKHFVIFSSPGTFVSESTTKEIAEWDPRAAVAMAEKIVERYNARSYGFTFETRLVADPIPDGRGGTLNVESRKLRESGTYFLGGKLETYDEVLARNEDREDILRGNMRGNGHWIVCVTTNGFRSTMPFGEKDFMVDAAGAIIERGDDPKHAAYRTAAKEKHEYKFERE